MQQRPFVTVVTGVPRSGTSLLMQVLRAGGIPACSDGARAPDRDNPRGYLEHALLRRLGKVPDAAALVRAAVGQSLKLVHLCVAALPAGPPYRVLLAERGLAAVVASQEQMLARIGQGEPAGGLAQDRLAEIFAAQLAEVREVLEARPDITWLPVCHEALLRDTAAACARIDAFLGGGLDRRAMVRAVEPALWHHREDGYTPAMANAFCETLGPLRFEVAHRAPGAAGGPTLRIHEGGHERLRFDCFAAGAHWHLDPEGRDEITLLSFAHEPITWTLEQLRGDLAGLLRKAGVRTPPPEAGALAALLVRVEAALRNPPAELGSLDVTLLRKRRGEKWQLYPEDVLPLWVADMDFLPAEPIRRRLQRALDLGELGYPVHPAPTALPEVFAARMQHRFGWRVDPRRVELLTEVVQGIFVALETLTQPGDGVIVQTPIYPPFLGCVDTMKRRVVESPLRESEAGYEVDLEGLRACAAEARMLLLCNPHNPSGRVFRRDELEGIAAIAEEHDLLVVSDEIHSELVYPGHSHIPFAALSPAAEARTLTLTSASKAFNVAGLRCALAVFGSADLRQRFLRFPRHLRGGLGNLGIEVAVVAWRHADPWLAEVLAYLEANRDFVAEFVKSELPGVRHHSPEATYLAWLDCRQLALEPTPYTFFLEQGRVALSNGPAFGAPGEGFVRLNFATSRPILSDALERMAKALKSR